MVSGVQNCHDIDFVIKLQGQVMMQTIEVIITYAPDKYCKIVEMSVEVDKIVVKLIASIIYVFCQQYKIHSDRFALFLRSFKIIVYNNTCLDLNTRYRIYN